MINIPTELLRTLVAVVDLRSFTKAAHSLGVTQPAVSAQIKRLQTLLDCEMFDKSAPGVSLTASGELVVNYARRMLNVNDQIVDLSAPRLGSRSLRIGVPGDFMTPHLPRLLERVRSLCPGLRLSIRSDRFDALVRDLRQGDLSLLVGLSETGTRLDARHQWAEPSVWVHNPSVPFDPAAPVPLVTLGETWSIHRAVVAALNRVQRDFEVSFVGPSEASVVTAVRCGLGVSALVRRRAERVGLPIWEDAPLPRIGDLYCGIYLGEIGERRQLEALADMIYEIMAPQDRGKTPPIEADEVLAHP